MVRKEGCMLGEQPLRKTYKTRAYRLTGSGGTKVGGTVKDLG